MGAFTSMEALQGLEKLVPTVDYLCPPQTVLKDGATYDYIVVGAGTAGSAARLVEDQSNDVLLLEAGDNPPLSVFLAALFILLPHSKVDYDYRATFDSYAASAAGNHTLLTEGKTLGGSLSIGHFIHTRGSHHDYNKWAKITNDDSWRYENVLKYFIKSENFDDQEVVNTYPQYHGTKGPIEVTRLIRPGLEEYFKSFAEVGNPYVLDLNANVSVGYTYPSVTIDDRMRQTTLKYITPMKLNKNLHYSKNTRAVKIIFKGKRAIAVEVIYEGKKYSLKARKEIIVSAGVFNTPQLLQLSGVGPRKQLEKLNIDVIADLPVGDNLADQTVVHIVIKTTKHLLPIPSPSNLQAIDPTRIPFGVILGAAALNKSKTSEANYQVFCLDAAHDFPIISISCSTVFGLRNDLCDKLQAEVKSRDALYCLVFNVQQKSRGTVRLRNLDPFSDPVITTGYYTNNQDLKNAKLNVKDYIKVLKSSYFRKIQAELAGLDVPECKDKKNDDFWECYILHMSGSGYHYRGSCVMGSVVNGDLKLKGFEGIRIVDVSVMPQVSSTVQSSVIMLAEKAADMIKADSLN